ncbi:lysophospholipid acyltransferase family protein [Porphyromonas loveana]|uniref:Putative hemolysin n=1 Tax=Porphyromonas loveana TaxID=1884669 RepID=A0A2U1F9G2_9PORP|nr:lysophospholipid acyltransferase family protein [Porphyromonas loveana]PVZ08804.1 putative hemolysin [Porphyromonas loveana]
MVDSRPEVLTEEDVHRLFPVLEGERRVTRRLLKALKITDINAVHARHINLRGAAFAHAALTDPAINVSYRLHGAEHLEEMRKSGAFTTVSNHPFGSIDGIMLIDIIGSVRPDYSVLVNGFLSMISCLRDSFIPVAPPRGIAGGTESKNNVSGVKEVLHRLQAGQPVGFFPAGGISVYKGNRNRVMDSEWQASCAKMILASHAPVYPIFFSGRNSWYFHFLGWLSWTIRTPRIPAELFNKRGHVFDVYIGEPIAPETIARFEKSPRELALFLYDRTYCLAPRRQKKK